MARFTIYSKDGAARHSGNPQFNGSYMGVDYLEFRSISSPVPIDWERGDFVDYYRTGLRYRLYSTPMPGKVARRGEYGGSFEYSNVQFHAATKELEIAPFRDLVPKDNRIHFSTRPDVSTYEDVYGIARRIQECMNDLFPNRWRIEVVETEDESLLSLLHEVKEYSVSNGTCLDALAQIYELWKSVGWIHTYDAANEVDVITIGRANVRDAENTSDVFAYGKGNGLTSIKKAAANAGEFATRLYVYGSDRNIQTRYYNGKNIVDKDSVDIRNLMLPIESWGKTDGLPDARKAFLQADDAIVAKYGLIPRTVYFDGNEHEEIYPSIIGLTESKVRAAMIESGEGGSSLLPSDTDERIDKVLGCSQPYDNGDKDSVEATPTFLLAIRQLGFDLHKQGRLTDAGHAVISMRSGDCAGREFVVKSFDGSSRYPNIVLERYWDDSLGMGFPNGIYRIEPEDEFVILDIPMPEYYISINEDKLLEAGKKLLADYTRVSAFYEPGINPIRIKEGGKPLHPGMYMQVYDEDIIDTEDKTDYVLIDSLSIDEASELPQYKVTLREEKRAARTFSALEDMIEDARGSNNDNVKQVKQYTERRFRSAQETLTMLQSAFNNFSEGINPVTVQTMAMLIGDESLQFKFTSPAGTLPTKPSISYDSAAKILKIARSYRIWHMTLGIDSVTSPGGRSNDDYLKWTMPTWNSGVLDDASKSYYLYAKVATDDTTGDYVLSESAISMESEQDYYHLLVGVLNREYDGTREFVPLYGFTEVLPGQITTDVIRSADGNAALDLVNGLLTFGRLVGLSGQTAADGNNLRIWAGKGESDKEEAPFRVYDDGSVYASLMSLLNGCKIGKLTITEDGILVNTTSGGTISINQYGVRAVQKDGSSAELGVCGSQAAMILGKDAGGQCYVDEDTYKIGAQINAANGYHAVHSLSGVYAGLRPNIREVQTSDVLDALDHTIILSNKTGMSLTLPRNPQTGQTYRLIHTTNMRVDLVCGSGDLIIDAATAGTVVSYFNNRTTLTLTYFGGVWYAEFK